MPVTMFSHTFRLRLLLYATILLRVSELSFETSVQNMFSSQLVQENNLQNNSSKTVGEHGTFTSDTYKISSTPGAGGDPFPWDKSTTTASEYQMHYCATGCYDTLLIVRHRIEMYQRVECFPCDCNKPLCEFYETCCRDTDDTVSGKTNLVSRNTSPSNIHSSIHSQVTEMEINVTRETTTDLVCDGDGEMGSLYYRSCPSNYPEVEVVSKCRKDMSPSDQDLDTFAHVVNNVTKHAYYNKHCAVCNSVSSLIVWTISIECDNNMQVDTSRTLNELLPLSLSSDSGCKTLQKPPNGVTLHPCHRQWFPDKIVDTCNVTGEWGVYDEDVIKACADLSGTENRFVLRTRIEDTVYRNLFCAMCNMNGYLESPTFSTSYNFHVVPYDVVYERKPAFEVFLNFGPNKRILTLKPKCKENSEWKSPDNECLPLQCSPGKVLVNGGCSTTLSEIHGPLYHLQVYYVPTVSMLISHSDAMMLLETNYTSDFYKNCLNVFKGRINEAILHIGQEFKMMLTMVFSNQTLSTSENQTDKLWNSSSIFQISWFTAEGFIQANSSYSQEFTESFILKKLILNNLTLDINENTQMTLTPVLHAQRNIEYLNCNSSAKKKYTCSSIFVALFDNTVPDKDIREAIIIEPHLNKPFVQFSKTEYSYETIASLPPSSRIILYFNHAKMTFSKAAEINQMAIDEDGALRVCHDLLKIKKVETFTAKHISNLQLSKYILTLICLISSIICLAITLMTYFLFPGLRSVAGKNNMFLCGSLLMAQLSLIAISHIPQTGYLCAVLAVCTHYSWLSMFCWCFTCCFHMFSIFSAKTRNVQATASSERIYMIKRVVLCSVLPGLTVTGVITTNYSMSGGQLIGYGSATCFFDSQLIMIITLVVPLCLIIVLNFIFFSITVIKIYNVRRLQTREFRKEDHKNLYIYMKLSSMTGIFWILSVISEATNNDPLRFIAIGLNGLQGVFIFLSFICNRRVLRLYVKVLGLAKPLESSLNRSTIANVISEINNQPDRSENTSTAKTV